MHMIIKALIWKDNTWQPVGNIFKSALEENLLTDRVCDARDPILYEILGGPKTCRFNHTPITPVKCFASSLLDVDYETDLSDLLNYNWDSQIFQYSYISEFQYKMYKNTAVKPVNMLQYVRDRNAEIVDPFTMDMILKNPGLRTADKYYVKYQHTPKPLKFYCEFFCNESMPALIKLGLQSGDIHNIKIIYSFVKS